MQMSAITVKSTCSWKILVGVTIIHTGTSSSEVCHGLGGAGLAVRACRFRLFVALLQAFPTFPALFMLWQYLSRKQGFLLHLNKNILGPHSLHPNLT